MAPHIKSFIYMCHSKIVGLSVTTQLPEYVVSPIKMVSLLFGVSLGGRGRGALAVVRRVPRGHSVIE